MQNKAKTSEWSIFIVLMVIILSVFIFNFYYGNGNFKGQQSDNQQNQNEIKEPLSTIEKVIKEVNLPTPLVLSEKQDEVNVLEEKEILSWTNVYRANNGVQELTANEILNQAAQQKVKDMFEKQYFEHISPEGVGAVDIVEGLSYQYLRVGENLALGNFKDEKELVDAWMASPGHRENILNPKFKEIGIAAEIGMFKGEKTLLAVQIFASPLSDCPVPDENLKLSIETKEKEFQNLESELNFLNSEIETLQKNQETLYNQGKELLKTGVSDEEIDNINDQLQEINTEIQDKINSYNQLVSKINNLFQELQKLISTYNQQVEMFNQCLQM